MTIQEATKIAEKYCADKEKFRYALYSGKFAGGFLFRLNFNGGGHHGTPLFLVINSNGDVRNLEKYSEAFNKAWNASNDYLDRH